MDTLTKISVEHFTPRTTDTIVEMLCGYFFAGRV